MDDNRFDMMIKGLITTTSRRQVFGGCSVEQLPHEWVCVRSKPSRAAMARPRGRRTAVDALEAAGFAASREEELRVALPLPDPEPVATFWWEGNATYEALPPERQRAFRDEVLAAYGTFAVDDGIAVPAVFVLGTGSAP